MVRCVVMALVAGGSVLGCSASDPCASFDATLPSTGQAAGSFVWTGDEYLVLASYGTDEQPADNRIVRVNAHGIAGDFVTIPQARGYVPRVQGLAWSGSVLAVLVVDVGRGELCIDSYDAQGQHIHTNVLSEVRLNPSAARIAWAGDRFVVVWGQNGEPRIAELYPNGVTFVERATVDPLFASVLGMLVADEFTYAFMLDDAVHKRMLVFDRATGRITPVDLLALSGDAEHPAPTSAVAIRNHELGVFQDAIDNAWFVRASARGTSAARVSVPMIATSSALVTTPRGYRAFGLDEAAGVLQAVDIDPDGFAPSSAHALFTFPTRTMAGPLALSAPDRTALLFSYGQTSSSRFDTHRLVQQCER